MTTATATPAAHIKVGDRVRFEVGATNFATFEVEEVQMFAAADGTIVWTFEGYRSVNGGISGPSEFSLVDGDTAQVI